MDPNKYRYNHTPSYQFTAQVRAFIVSISCYSLLILLLGFYSFNGKKHPLFEQSLLQRQEAAPIKMVATPPPPEKKTIKEPVKPLPQMLEPSAQIPQAEPIQKIAASQLPKTTTPEQTLPEKKIMQPSISRQTASSTPEPPKAPQNTPERTSLLKQLRSPLRQENQQERTPIKRSERRRQAAWKRPTIKQGESAPARRPLLTAQYETTKKISEEFSQFVEAKQKKMLFQSTPKKNNNNESSYYWGEVAQQNAQRAEALSFFEHFLFSFCELSYQNQLSMKGMISKSHSIQLNITISRDRQIKRIEKITPSPIPQFNDHIAYLLSIMTPPIFPAHHQEDELIVPLNIQITIHPTVHSLYFVPAQF